MRGPLQGVVPKSLESSLSGRQAQCQCALPAFHPARKNFSRKMTRLPSMNRDAPNAVLGGSIATTWNPPGFYYTVSILFWAQRSCFRLQACFHPVLSIFDLEQTLSKIRLRPRDEMSPKIVRGIWEAAANALLNESVSTHRSSRGGCNVKSSECSLSATYACESSREKSTEFLQ
jgi:hypothetical protein